MNRNETLLTHWNGLLASYGQLFLSENKTFSVLVLLASYIDYHIGLMGSVCVIFLNIIADTLKFSRYSIKKGIYGFNALLTGLYIGYLYELNWQLLLFSFAISVLIFFLVIALNGIMGTWRLPFLSIPFLFAVWLIDLSVPGFTSIMHNQNSIFIRNEIMQVGGETLLNIYQFAQTINLPLWIEVYLKSLGAVVFQYNVISGLIILIGLIYYSRIAFVFSLVGLFCGLGFNALLHGNMDAYMYSFIGFNFILTALAIGCYFLVPNIYSLGLVIIVTPLIALIIAASTTFLSSVGLQVLSLPFNIAVLLTLYMLYFRQRTGGIHLVSLQLNSPERNLYRFISDKIKYTGDVFYKIALPFFGEWQISQAHEGEITHKGAWKHAWDFVISDDDYKTFRFPGTQVEDYYCYNLPVIAPCDGYVESIVDGVDDNLIGDVNLTQNWGNTIIIRHAPDLFIKLSHLKKGSLKVRAGDYVYKGQIIAANGSSGRSPEPHLHFQIQATPHIGSATIPYPISYYLSKEDTKLIFHQNGIPKKNEWVSNISVNSLLKDAFTFIPGQKIKWQFLDNIETWEVGTTVDNHSYLYHAESDSTLFYVNNGILFYCVSFTGKKNTALYAFYLACQKIVLGYYPALKLNDQIDVYDVFHPFIRSINDIFAPVKNNLQADFELSYCSTDNLLYTQKMELESQITIKVWKQIIKNYNFHIKLEAGKLISITDQRSKFPINYTCIG